MIKDKTPKWVRERLRKAEERKAKNTRRYEELEREQNLRRHAARYQADPAKENARVKASRLASAAKREREASQGTLPLQSSDVSPAAAREAAV